MFKIICDVKLINLNIIIKELTKAGKFQKSNLAPAAVKYKKAIGYDNCMACDIRNFKLTSTGKALSKLEVSGVLDIWSANFLSPADKSYHESYKKILSEYSSDSFDIKNFKYVGIFEKDTGLWQAMPDGLGVVQLFASIVDSTKYKHFRSLSTTEDYYNTGYKEYHHKSHFVTLTNATKNTFLGLWSLKTLGNDQYLIHNKLTPYILRHKGTFDCPEIKYHISDERVHIEEYIRFLEKDFVETLSMDMSSSRQCKLGDKVALFVDPSATQDSSNIDLVQMLCTNMGGKLASMRNTIEEICKKKGIEHQLYKGPPTVTCNDYDTMISFDADGEIISGEVAISTFAGKYYGHNEL